MQRITLFADVLLPVAIKGLFTYRVPFALNEAVAPLKRVIVPFGNKRISTGIIIRVHENPPSQHEAKYIEEILDEHPLVIDKQILFWNWLSEYYLCSTGEVMGAALPSSLKLQGETSIILHQDIADLSAEDFSIKEYTLLQHLANHQKIKLSEVSKLLGVKTIYPIIKNLWRKGLIKLEDEVKEKFKPLEVEFVWLNKEFESDEQMADLLDKLEKAPKQLDIVMSWLSLSGYLQRNTKEVLKTALIKKAGANVQAFQQLVKKKILRIEKKEISRLQRKDALYDTMPELNAAQSKAYDEINAAFQESKVVLLHGVTSSGKTEIYIRLIDEQLKAGRQVLYLLPEIALTAQIILRLQAHFGPKVLIYHSKFSENERAEVWRTMVEKADEPLLILGARSSLFLPFTRAGLVIVDEEHETSYKQQDPAPRYHARDAAIKLASMFKAKCILGSATPSLESYYNAETGKYALVELKERFGNAMMPDIIINDLRVDKKKKMMSGVFSKLMLEELRLTKSRERQSILFQNRRGYSPILECDDCGWTTDCVHCDISLTYHKRLNQLRCHYCGYSINLPPACKSCGSTSLKTKGFGTEKIEEDLLSFIPEMNTQRFDLDTTRSKYAYHQIIEAFEQKKIDVMIGTQMVTKGLDFDAVDLVGIMNADSMINFPDFRATERALQLMLQVAGRAGRRDVPGKVIIQTHQPQHKLFHHIVQHDYEGFYQSEIGERKQFSYPPFTKLIIFTVKHKEAEQTAFSAQKFAEALKAHFGILVLGPEEPPVSRLRNLFIRKIILKIPLNYSLHKVKLVITDLVQKFHLEKIHKGARVFADVDPV